MTASQDLAAPALGIDDRPPAEDAAPPHAYHVRVKGFDGPLDLLLALVRREKLDISQLSLAAVTGQYLLHLAALERLDPAEIAEFCEIAATLMLIKSRALLPRPPEMAPDEEDEAQALVERLRQYRRFRDAAERLGRRERTGLRAFVRQAPPPELPPFAGRAGEQGLSDLAAAFQRTLAEALAKAEAEARPEAPQSPPAPRLLLADRFREIRDLIHARGRLAFLEAILGPRPDREFIIVSFLAVLELLRRALIRARQPEVFGEIFLEARPEATGWEQAEVTESALGEDLPEPLP